MCLREGRIGWLGFVLLGLVSTAGADIIHACVNPASGELRIISESNHCNPSENALAWTTRLERKTTPERVRAPTLSEPREGPKLSDINLYLE